MRDDTGATAVENALLIVLVVIAAMTAITLLGSAVNANYDRTESIVGRPIQTGLASYTLDPVPPPEETP